jgi:hypothetical protein
MDNYDAPAKIKWRHDDDAPAEMRFGGLAMDAGPLKRLGSPDR